MTRSGTNLRASLEAGLGIRTRLVFSAFCRRRGWQTAALTGGLQRRREPADRTKAIPYPQLDRLWRRDDVAAREKAIWRLHYESAARAQEVLSLNVEDLDLENERARVRSKGGDIEWLHLQSGSARLLPKLIGGRLSYRRAEKLLHAASGGWALHQLRHSAITHLAEADVGLALLVAKSRHTSQPPNASGATDSDGEQHPRSPPPPHRAAPPPLGDSRSVVQR